MANLIDVTLTRLNGDDQGTTSIVLCKGRRFYGLEPPWRDNQPNISCIPEGEYRVLWTKSPRLRIYTYEIQNVEGRGGIRIHSGNYAGDVEKGYRSDSKGCPLLGNKLGIMHGQVAVLQSRFARVDFEQMLEKKPFNLIVRSKELYHA